MNRQAFSDATAKLGISLSSTQLDQFEAFEEALYKANETTNLTRVPREECAIRHFLDSLLGQHLIPDGARVLDIGCGPGFPCLPLAIARPDLVVTGLDSAGKMTRFLTDNAPGNLLVVTDRAESWGVREKFDVVTGRALAPLTIQLELSAPPCKTGGIVLPLRTPSDREEAERLGEPLNLKLREIQEVRLGDTDVVRLIPVYEKLGWTTSVYPRLWSEIKRKPL